MGIKKNLYEQYDDVFFKALMSDVAKEEGKRLIEENERLKADPSFEMPEPVYRHGLQTIRRAFRKEVRDTKTRKAGRLIYRIAAVIIVLMLLTAIVFAAFPDLRAELLNTFLNIYETHTDFTFTPENTETNDALQITTLWFPSGFELSEKNGTSLEYWEIWRKGSGMITIKKSTAQTQHIDTENAKIELILVQQYSGYIITKPSVCRIIWLNTDNGVTYYVCGEDVDEETVIKIAKNMH